MGCCDNNRKFECGSKTPSTCVFYEGDIPEYSKLNEEKCVVVEETTEDLYNLVTWLKEAVEITDVDCLEVDKKEDTYDKTKTRYLLKDVVEALVKKSCVGSDNHNTSTTDSNVLSGLDYKCLIDDCWEEPKSLKHLLQLIIDKICQDGY